jgi:hypothetical protein
VGPGYKAAKLVDETLAQIHARTRKRVCNCPCCFSSRKII